MEKAVKLACYYAEEHLFKKSIATLREVALKANLQETYKWNFPTYMINGKNVLSICKFNEHCGIWFFKGVFLSDPEKVLQNSQKGKTQAMRHWKFMVDVDINVKKVLDYMNEAIENEKNGKKLTPKKKLPLIVVLPTELKEHLQKEKDLKKAFGDLSNYQQKEYCDYITTAKQAKTKRSRLRKILPLISEGKGLKQIYK